jgi:hypothetical protein
VLARHLKELIMVPYRFLRGLRLALAFVLLTATARVAGASPLSVYYDQLYSGFADWSWADHSLAQDRVVHSGKAAISFEPDAWKALFLHRNGVLRTADYTAIEIWIHGGPNGGQKLRVRGALGGDPIGVGAPLSDFLPGGVLPGNQWVKVQVPLVSLGLLSGNFDGIWLQDDTGGDQETVFVDDIELLTPLPDNIYDDQLRNGFENWSWAPVSFTESSVVFTGPYSISFEPTAWSALFFHKEGGINRQDFVGVSFCVNGGEASYQKLRLALLDVGTQIASLPIDGFIPGGAIRAHTWLCVSIPFSALPSSAPFDGIWLQSDVGWDQPTVYVDQVRLLPNANPGPVQVTISPEAARRPISPLIYGVNFNSFDPAPKLPWPVRRWGGNATSRYSWQDDVSNRAFDWYFANIPETNAHPENLPDGSLADRFIDETRAQGGEVLMTMPTIGWTPIDRQVRVGFAVDKYGAQADQNCTILPGGKCAGNGVYPNGAPVTGNDPHDTSREVGPTFDMDWMAHIASRTGSAGQGGVRFFALDNEPILWNSSHRDVHPNPVTFDELWQNTYNYASAIKAMDRNAEIFGPVTWGWCDLFGSAADSCANGPDRDAHGGTPLLQWYLQKVGQTERETGVRLVDWVDIHYYPQAPAVTLSDNELPTVAARRLRSLQGLYDPSYVDESWIEQPVDLIPRVKGWIADSLPGARLAITEYNWGNDDGLTSALAQAEALAIFGREGVDLATRWLEPKSGSLVEKAFRFYLDYDGHGSRLYGDSVQTVSSRPGTVGAYTIWASGTLIKKIYVLLFNKDESTRHVDVGLTSQTLRGSQPALYRLDAAGLNPVSQSVTLGTTGFGIDLPGRSATLAVVTLR